MLKALESFLGKTERQIQDSILQTLEGHLRSILGTLTVEEVSVALVFCVCKCNFGLLCSVIELHSYSRGSSCQDPRTWFENICLACCILIEVLFFWTRGPFTSMALD